MKKNFTAWMSALALAGSMVCATNLAAQQPTPVPTTPPPGAGGKSGMPQRKGGERHPEINAAIRHLEQAKNALQHASHDFAGHRVKALEHTEAALNECREALASDKN